MSSLSKDQFKQYRAAIYVPFANVPAHGLRIAVIPDTQLRIGVPMEHLRWAGQYIADKQPDVIVCIGDFADMPSLGTHDKPGALSYEGQRYEKDIYAAKVGMEMLLDPIEKAAGYKPVKILTYGNHEHRIIRSVNENPRGKQASLEDLEYEKFGWRTVPFLQPVVIEGVAFCHYFPSGVMGRPFTKPGALLRQGSMSAVAGHQQGYDIARSKRLDGAELKAIITGSFYQHNEDYLNPYTNEHWRGMLFLNQVRNGSYDEMPLSIDFLKRRYS